MFKLYHSAGETYDGFWPSTDIDDGCCGIISTKGSNFGQVNIILFSLTGGEIYYNYKNESGWKYTSGNNWERVDNFGCNSLSSLAFALADKVTIVGNSNDLNDIQTPGNYQIINGNLPTHFPTGVGSNAYLVVKRFLDGTRVIQTIYSAQSNSVIVERTYQGSSTGWTNWQRMDCFGCFTLAELKAALATV